jgi:hypothetical protein
MALRKSSITQLPPEQMFEALGKLEDEAEIRALAHEVNVVYSPDTDIKAIKDKIAETIEKNAKRDGTPQAVTRSAREGAPKGAPELAVAGEKNQTVDAKHVNPDPQDLRGPDKQGKPYVGDDVTLTTSPADKPDDKTSKKK